MSEHLAPDPKPSCCLSSPQGTCEAHATYSEAELRIMELEGQINRLEGRAARVMRSMRVAVDTEKDIPPCVIKVWLDALDGEFDE